MARLNFHPAALAAAFAAVLSAGCCAGPLAPSTAMVSSYQPGNFFREAAQLPKDIKRVAILPLTAAGAESEIEFGRESLGPVLLEELGKTRKFELVAISSEQLRRWTGRASWSGEEKLPQDFFEKLRSVLGCDAVLFCRLTQYRAYQPLAVGWHLKLLEAEEPHVLWSVDEVFDAQEPSVAAAARRYAQAHPPAAASGGEAQTILSSPRRFAQYAASAVIETMPAR